MTIENYFAADAAAVVAWAKEKPRRAAHIAFTAGPERQAAYWIEWAEAVERERCAKIISDYPVPVGNSAAGELAAEWTITALREIRGEIRGG
jgi:hypothetical protein